MAFDYPPSILGGITHPDVIQQPGAGGAIASGLGAVLAAIEQKKLNDQQAQMLQATLGQKAAETEQATAGAKEAGARTGLYQQQTSDLSQKATLEAADQKAKLAGRALVMANATTASDPVAFARLLSTAPPAVAAHALDFRNLLLKGNEQAATANEAQARANVATAEAPGKIAASRLEDVLGSDVAQRVAADPNYRKLASYAKAGLLPLIMERERQAAENLRADKTQNRQDLSMERAQLHENFRVLLGQNEDDRKQLQSYQQNRSLAQLSGPEALKQFDADNPKVNQQSLEAYHAQQLNMQIPEYRNWRAGVLRQGAAAVARHSASLAPDEQAAVKAAVQMIRSKKGTLDQWRDHVTSSGMNPALVAEVEAQIGTQSK